MQKNSLKMKIAIFLILMIFMFGYMKVFGNNNAVIGIIIVLAALVNLRNDLSFRPKMSVIKILVLLFVLCIAAFLNNPISIGGCALTFLVVFATTFTSYHLFSTDVYIPYLMGYFMMMCIPVTLEDLPLRFAGLAVGALFIVGINLLANRKKSYNLSKATVEGLKSEIIKAIDVKMDGGEVSKESFKVANDFYNNIFSRLEYKYLPSQDQEAVLNITKSFQAIGWGLSDKDFTTSELSYLKGAINDIENLKSGEIFEGVEIETKEFSLILLHLEVIANEIENRDWTHESVLPDKKTIRQLIMPLIRKQFSLRSAKFTFALKMALVLTLWEVLTLMFNLPYTKWLYFASIPLMLPYVNDVAFMAKSRVMGTIGGIFVFALIILVIPHIPISVNVLVMLIFVVCMFGMVYNMKDKLQMTIFTTIMSVMSSLMYIELPEAMILKILWVVVAVIVVSIINFGFLPYSVEKETRNNLIASYKLNEESINLVKSKAMGEEVSKKTALLVVSNLVRENIEITDENRHLCQLQYEITDICNFIINYMNLHDFSEDTKRMMVGIIQNNEHFDDCEDVLDKIMLFSTGYVVDLLNEEKELIGLL